MDLSRISGVIDVNRLQAAEVTVIGVGGSADLIAGLARCGVGRFNLIDHDRVALSNIARQGHDADEVGRLKVEAEAARIARINPAATVSCLPRSFLDLPDTDVDHYLGGTDLFVYATDRFEVQARGNAVALRLNRPALWIGLYPGGLAGEVIWWAAHIDACFRCLCGKRYKAHEAAAQEGLSLDPSSDGCTIFDVSLLDSVAGMLAIGLLTRGSDNRFGRLIDQLGDRNFIQVQLDPAWNLNGRSVVRDQLGVRPDCPTFFSWNAIARSDPDHGRPPCPDCQEYRGRKTNPQ